MPYIKLDEVKSREIIPGYIGRFVHTGLNTIGYIHIQAGAPLPEHAHRHEQVTSVIEGQFEVTLAGETRVLGPGMVFHAPPGVPHSACALTDCYVIDVFLPVREDFI